MLRGRHSHCQGRWAERLQRGDPIRLFPGLALRGISTPAYATYKAGVDSCTAVGFDFVEKLMQLWATKSSNQEEATQNRVNVLVLWPAASDWWLLL